MPDHGTSKVMNVECHAGQEGRKDSVATAQDQEGPSQAAGVTELLPGMESAFAEFAMEIPPGFSDLTRRQKTFVLEYLRTGNQTEAAFRAGYSSPSADGAKVKKTAAVAGVLRGVALKFAKDTDQLITRVSERSRALHADIENERAKADTLRNESRLFKLCAQADRTDALLGSLLGKMQGVHVSGSVTHSHASMVLVPEDALPVMARLRREVVVSRKTQVAS